MQVYDPVQGLGPYIKSFVVVQTNQKFCSRLLPGTAVVAAIRLRGKVQLSSRDSSACLPLVSVSGLRSSYRLAEYDANSINIIVEFQEGGAGAFLDFPMHELFESNVGLDHFLLSSELIRLHEQMEAHESIQAKVSVLQQFFCSKLHRPKTDALVTSAVEKIRSAQGLLNIKQLAAGFHISLDPFEKRFRKFVGATPKQFSDIIRMNALITQARKKGPMLNAALNAGFFDQSHFIRTFKKFTGQTPKEFFDESGPGSGASADLHQKV